MQRLLFLLICLILIACSDQSSSKEPLPLTDQDREQIAEFSGRLIASINGFDFSVFNSSWNNPAFKRRMKQIDHTQKSVLAYLSEEMEKQIKFGNLSIIHEVNDGRGEVLQVGLNFFDTYAELVLLSNFANAYNFFKYRIEMVGGRPVLSDYLEFREDFWYSEKIVNFLRHNSEYNAYSKERHQTNDAMNTSQAYLATGDTLSALQYLYEVPPTHQLGNELSLMKIDLAASLGDSIHASVLNAEFEQHPNLYVRYLYHYFYADTADLEIVYQTLEDRIGDNNVLDSLVLAGKVWN